MDGNFSTAKTVTLRLTDGQASQQLLEHDLKLKPKRFRTAL